MSAVIIDGKRIAQNIREQLKQEVARLQDRGIRPGLAVVLVGNNPASLTYVRGKQRACQEVGIYSELIHLPETITERELMDEIARLNERDEIDGILVQLPLPGHIRARAVIGQIDEAKDVDGFTPRNVGNLVIQDGCFLPCTPHGILRLIQETGYGIAGRHAVVIGRSNIVGKPVAMLLLHENATVTICHSHTPNLQEMARQADILVAAVGQPRLITESYVKPGALVIDVGINRLENGQLVGDVDFERVRKVAGYITPVPGGVGPMTITMLLQNTVQAAMQRRG